CSNQSTRFVGRNFEDFPTHEGGAPSGCPDPPPRVSEWCRAIGREAGLLRSTIRLLLRSAWQLECILFPTPQRIRQNQCGLRESNAWKYAPVHSTGIVANALTPRGGWGGQCGAIPPRAVVPVSDRDRDSLSGS